ncbi:hypothetical protein J437_LFUL010478 [Ladona fulva]|uniref:Acyl-CoA dehydrogenase/oxidase N-terminal domain-containing protein n=1 Tax=Ladona fulva TaxID=123851 RepID=A0A8K0PAA1_LADFU|nr:hypothetical protein J437_LFUL010478 [Ladona fulva]
MSRVHFLRLWCRLEPYRHIERSNYQCCRLLCDRSVQELIDSDTRSELTAIKKKPKRNPFVKNLFLGKFDTEYLAFPEVLNKEQLQNLEELLSPIEKFFNEVDSQEIDRSATIPEKTLTTLKELGLFGQQIPTEYGGLGLSATEYARFAEITALDGSIAVTLAAHQAIGLKVKI